MAHKLQYRGNQKNIKTSSEDLPVSSTNLITIN